VKKSEQLKSIAESLKKIASDRYRIENSIEALTTMIDRLMLEKLTTEVRGRIADLEPVELLELSYMLTEQEQKSAKGIAKKQARIKSEPALN
jgi:hypothetical protein